MDPSTYTMKIMREWMKYGRIIVCTLRRLFTQRLHGCQAKQSQGPQIFFLSILKAPSPKLAGPPQVVQTLAKAKKLCPHQAQQRLSSLSLPKRDPDYFALGDVCPQLFPFSGVGPDVRVLAGFHDLCFFGHDLIVPQRDPDLGSDDARGVRPYGVNIHNIRIAIDSIQYFSRCRVGR